MDTRAAAAVVLVVLATSCRSSHIEGTKVCRHYPTAFTESGRSYTCSFDGSTRFACDDTSRFVIQQWVYANQTDFLLEAQVPNRVLAQSRSFITLGLVVTSSTFVTDYLYDASGRLLERRRHRSDVSRQLDLDTTQYTAWDSSGRPTAGTISAPEGTGPITIHYDDQARRMVASNGESVTQDANGNVVREDVVIGFGAPGTNDFTILARRTSVSSATRLT